MSAGVVGTQPALSVADMLGDPAEWRCVKVVNDWGTGNAIYGCPLCGAACLNPHQHKDWHIQQQ